jgi:hypothetical protein
MFQTTFADEGRLYLLIYGEPKVGKTRAVLDMVKDHGHYMVLMSSDRGLLYVNHHPKAFEKRLAVAYPRNLKDVRKTLKEAQKKVAKLLAAGVPPQKIWLVVDNITHLQQRLMKEARKVQVEGNSASGRGSIDTEYRREMTTDVDYGVNLGHMVEIADELDTVNCNVCVIALAKAEYTAGRNDRKATGKKIIDMSGQPARRFAGDADAIMLMDRDKSGAAFFKIHGSGSGGDRSGYLEALEPADLLYIVSKMHGKHEQLALQAPADEPEADEPAAEATEAAPDVTTEPEPVAPSTYSPVAQA